MKPYLSTPVYRYALLAAALLLAAPAILSFSVDREARAVIERRDLNEAPDPSQLLNAPQAYFASLNRFLGDWTAGVVGAKKALSMTRYYLFEDTPSELLHLGIGQTVFVHTFAPDRPYQAANVCLPRIQALILEQLPADIAELDAHFAERGADVRLLLVPSKITLYGDRFTRVAPPNVVRACTRTARNNPLVALNDTGSGLIHYPWGAMREGRDDPDFYPSGSFHWQGESVHAVMESWIAAQPETPLRPLDGTYETVELEQDIPGIVGFDRHYYGRQYSYLAHGVHRITEAPEGFPRAVLARQRVQHYLADNPVFDRRVLVISNSFGIEGHLHLAPIYRELLDGWAVQYAPDTVIILLHDSAALRTGQVVEALR